jgi:3-oxoacyl-[acyl-carrier-protein] synthase II
LTAWKNETNCIDDVKWAEVALERMNVVRELEQEPNMPLSHLALLTGARGPALNCLTACAASTQAIGEATEILRRGDADVMIGGGAHSMIHPFGVTGFNRLTALSTANENPSRASRPFDAQRGGFVLGEGAGMVILETLDHATARNAPILAEVVGYGSTADAFRITDQHPEGEGAIAAMKEALADAGLTPGDIHYINAHGTGTRENDGNETGAIKAVFGPSARCCPVSSIKSMMGHLIAAAGAVELICCVLAIRDGILPPTMNLENFDPECDLDYVPNKARKAKVDVAMSNSFGFGGQNDTIIVRRFVG